jgi:tetratricopeptide (TPR) repeat protein
MSTILDDPKRRTVPRWRLWRDAVRLGDSDASVDLHLSKKPNPEDLIKAKFEWDKHRSLPFAGDFAGKAYALGLGATARDAAEFILKAQSRTSEAARNLAGLILAEQTSDGNILSEPLQLNTEDRRCRIKRLRTTLREFPRNPLACMNLAREYVVLGQPWAALAPVRMALALAPNSRFVLRSASRFFLHINDPEQAHNILRKSDRLKVDPWVSAAEIAVASAAGRSPFSAKIGRQFIGSQNFSAFHVSELASALGTLEWEAGNISRVKRLFHHALQNPTENVVAQAGWLSRRIGNLGLTPHILETPMSYEARAWSNTLDGRWNESLNASELWLHDEPFAKRPAVFGSWVALTTAHDFEAAERLAQHGLKTHPREFLLLNNRSVALAYLGEASKAAEVFKDIPQADAEGDYKPTYLATMGLIQFRLGSVAEGRRLYRMSVAEANRRRDFRTAAWALLHFAREEFRCDPVIAEELVKEARRSFPKLSKIEEKISLRLLELVKNR